MRGRNAVAAYGWVVPADRPVAKACVADGLSRAVRVLILSQWFDPEPHYKGMVFARALASRGHDVEVLTGFPNYPGGTVYPGYRIRVFQRETIDGIKVLRVPLFPSHDRSAVGRIANYLSFALAAVPGIFMRPRYDAVYVYNPPPTAAAAACIYRKLRGVPYLCDVQDLWPDTLAATGMLRNRTALRIVGFFVDMLLRGASGIAVLSDGFKSRLIERGHDPAKVVVIPNWSPDTALPSGAVPPPPIDGPAPGRFRIVFAGNIGSVQDLDVVIEAADRLRDIAPDVEFVIVGDGTDLPRLRAGAAKLELTNVTFPGRRPPWAMEAVFDQADALLVHLAPDPLFEITIPSKTQAYLRAGKPILIGVAGDAATLVEQAGAGIAFQPGSADRLVDAIMTLRTMSASSRRTMGDSGKRYYDAHLSIEHGVDAFDRALQAIQKDRPPS